MSKPTLMMGLVCLIAFCSLTARAAEPLLVTDADTELSLGFHLEYLEDKEGTLTLEDVLKPEVAARFVKSQVETPNFGLGLSSAYWFSFELKNPGSEAIERLLEIGYPLLDDIHYYRISETGERAHLHLGDKLVFSERPIDHRNFVIPVELNSGEVARIVMRVQTSSSFRVPLVLWGVQEFFEHDVKIVMVSGLFYGVLLVMALYNLFVFLSLRHRSYLYYVLFVTGVLFGNISWHGFGYQYFWSFSTWWAENSFLVFMISGLLAAAVFSSQFLRLSEHARKHYRVLQVCMALGLIDFVCIFIAPYSLSIRLLVCATLGGSVCVFSAGILRWRQGSIEARYYVVAWAALVLGNLLNLAGVAGVLPSNVITNNGIQIGITLEIVLLSLALARQLKSLNEQTKSLNQSLIQKSQELVVALDQAKSADKLKGEILANLSHELRTPLNALINVPRMLSEQLRVGHFWHCDGCGETFEDNGDGKTEDEPACPECGVTLGGFKQFDCEADPEEVMVLLTHTARSGVHLAKTISDMLEFAKLESGSTVVSKHSIASRNILDDVTSKLLSFAEKKGVSIAVDLPGDTRLHVDAEKIDLLFQKLIENAIEFSPADETVAVCGAPVSNGEKLRISVQDQGPGIAAADQGTIFESFRQLESGHTRSHPGVGLGLSIAASIAEAHGTKIEVDSEPGKGSTFSVELPLDSEKVG